ncbi:MAG: hypothetical protein BIFFINMI_03689 [Phycisphaerae bacterium]|nr:hypothetical protein [Phycisphaerae bacterium]
MTRIDEIAPDVFRISLFAEQFNLQFNHFLVRDDQPLLFHAGMRGMFQPLADAVGELIDPRRLRWVSWSHFEVDECGGLNRWLSLAPSAQGLCGVVGAMVNMGDYADRPVRAMDAGEVLDTGRHRFTYHATPHLPHGWDAGLLLEQTTRTLFCSDLVHQVGDVEPLTESADVLGRTRDAIVSYQSGPLMDYLPYTPNTARLLGKLADLNPATLAVMHGSSFRGDGGAVLRGLSPILREVFAGETR